MAESEKPTPLIEDAMDSAQAPSLCTQCGLCCSGAIYSRAVLDEDEVAPARAIGLPVLDLPGRPAFALGCPKLVGTQCSIFGHRPRVCGRFRCQLLIDFEEGRASHSEALAHVQEAQRLLGETREGDPAAESPLGVHKLALQLYLDRHFRKASDTMSFETSSEEPVMSADLEESLFSRSDEALFAEVGEDVLALHVANGRCHGMERVAADVWRMLDQPVSLAEICGRLVADYEVEPDECRRDVGALLQSMIAEGLVKAS